MNGNTTEVRLIAARLPVNGQTSGEVCPKCRGGLTGEKSLSVYRGAAGASWKCHRSSCGFQGHIGAAGTAGSSVGLTPSVKQEAKPYVPKIQGVPSAIVDELEARYNILQETQLRQGFVWTPDLGGRLGMPIRTRWMNSIGYSFRSFTDGKPKNLIIRDGSEAPTLAWYLGSQEPAASLYQPELPIVVVEDQLSALRVTPYANAVAMLGTGLSAVKIMDIVNTKTKHVILAFDRDASEEATRYLKLYTPFFDKLSMVLLEKDLKDSSDEAIKQILDIA